MMNHLNGRSLEKYSQVMRGMKEREGGRERGRGREQERKTGEEDEGEGR